MTREERFKKVVEIAVQSLGLANFLRFADDMNSLQNKDGKRRYGHAEFLEMVLEKRHEIETDKPLNFVE